MKKFISTLIALTLLIISMSGCYYNIPLLDASQSNLNGDMFNPVMETDIGYYYKNVMGRYSLRYFDKATNMDIYLCAKPECVHDGNLYCPATSSGFYAQYITLYGDFLYITGTRTENDRSYQSLYRASLDGTELTLLVDYIKASATGLTDKTTGGLTIHKGKAFIPYYIGQYISDDAEEKNNKKDNISGLVVVDLVTLKCEIIEEVNGIKEGIHTEIKASGDYIYYVLVNSGTTNYMKRYNIKDKTLETLPVGMYINSYAIIGDEILYTNAYSSVSASIKKYNTITGETTDFKWDNIIPNGREEVDEDGNIYFVDRELGVKEIMYDGKYLHVSNVGYFTGESKYFTRYYSSGKADLAEIYICTLDGKKLAKYTHEVNYNSERYSIHILNGKVYFQTFYKLESCPIQDIIDGNVVWTTEIEFDLSYLPDEFLP